MCNAKIFDLTPNAWVFCYWNMLNLVKYHTILKWINICPSLHLCWVVQAWQLWHLMSKCSWAKLWNLHSWWNYLSLYFTSNFAFWIYSNLRLSCVFLNLCSLGRNILNVLIIFHRSISNDIFKRLAPSRFICFQLVFFYLLREFPFPS